MATSVRPPASAGAPVAAAPEQGWSVRRAVWGLVAVGVLLRAWVVLAGWFAGDDYVLQGFAWRSDLDPAYLASTPTGELMPGGLALQWQLAHAFPMDHAPIALALILGQAAALVLFALLALELWGRRRLAVVPVALVAVSPAALTAGASWSNALGLLPFQIALTVLLLGAARWWRTGRLGWLIAGVVLWMPSLAFGSAALVVPLLALLLVPALAGDLRVRTALASALRRGWPAWLLAAAATVAYVVASVRLDAWPARSLPEVSQAADVLARGVTTALAPTVVGGPLDWVPAGAATAFAAPPGWLVLVAAELLIVLVVWSSARSRPARRAWVWAAVCLVLDVLLAVTGPLAQASPLFVQTLTLTAQSAVPLAVAVGFGLAGIAPDAAALLRRTGNLRPAAALRTLGAVAVILLVVTSTVSTSRYREIVRANDTQAYVAAARESLAAAADGPTLIDQAVPGRMVSPLRFPYNQASYVLAPLQPRPEWANPTTLLRILDDTGALRPALVEGIAAQPGPVQGCGWIVRDQADIWLASSVVDFSHLVRVGYLSTGAGVATIGFAGGATKTFPVTQGLGEVVVRLSGGGGVLKITGLTPGVTLCTDDVRVGRATVVEQ